MEKRTILVADDVSPSFTHEVLRQNGFSVVEASTEESAVETVRNNAAIDLVIIAVGLGSGSTAVSTARRVLDLRSLPIMFLAGNESPAVLEEASQIPSVGWISRNAEPSVVLASVKAALRLARDRGMKQCFGKESAAQEEAKDGLSSLQLEGIPLGYLAWDEEGRLTHWNAAAERIFGWKAEEVVGSALADHMIPQNLKAIMKGCCGGQRVDQGPAEVIDETLRKDGRRITCQWNAQTLRDAAGAAIGCIALVQDISEMRKTQIALQESEERYSSIVDRSPSIIVVYQDGKVIYVNSACVDVLGYAPSEVMGRSITEFMTAESALRARAAVEDRKVGKDVRPYEISLVTASGGIRFGLVQATAIRLYGNNAIVVAITDITELKLAEEALRRSEERYRVLVEKIEVPVVVTAVADGQVLFINACASRFFGADQVTAPLLFGKDFWIDPDDRFAYRRLIFERGYAPKFEAHVLAANKSERWVYISGLVIEFEGRQALFSIFEDITAEKEAADALRVSNDRYQSLFASSLVGAYAMDLDGRLLDANDSLLRMIGYEKTDLPILSTKNLLEESERMKAQQSRDEILRRGHDSDLREWRIRRKDGSRRWIETEAITMSKNGMPYAVHGIARDVTDRKAASEKLQRENNHLREINRLGTELDSISSQRGLLRYIASTLRTLTGASAVFVGEYSSGNRAIHLDQSEIPFESRLLFDILVRHGFPVDLGPMPEEMISRMFMNQVEYVPNLTVLSFGAISPEASRTICETFNLGSFCVATFACEGEVFGTSMLAFEEGAVLPDIEFVKAFASLTAFTFRRLKAESAMRESEERIRSVYENALMGIYRCLPSGECVMANPALLQMLGHETLADLAAKGIEGWGSGLTVDRRAFLEALIHRSSSESHEVEWLRADGTAIWVRENLRAIRDADGTVVFVDGTVEDVTSRKQAEEVVERSLKEQEALFRELQHRVKNSLSTIRSLVGIEQTRSSSPEVRATLRTVGERISSIANLYSLLSASGTTEHVRLDHYLRQISETLVGAYISDADRVTLILDCENIVVNPREAIPFGLIANEAVTNSLKYAFPDGRKGTIRVVLRRTEEGLDLTVADDGVGMKPAPHGDRSSGMGMELIKILTEQLRGSVTWERSAGTALTLRAPRE